MDAETIRRHLSNRDSFAENRFAILGALVRMANDERSVVVARELVIRTLALRTALGAGATGFERVVDLHDSLRLNGT